MLFTFWNKYSSQTTGDVSIQDDAMIIIGIDVFFTESKEFPKSSQAEAPIVRAAESRKSSIWKKNVDSVTVDRVNSYVTFGVKFLTCIQTNILLFSYGYWRSVFLLIWLSADNLKLVSVSPRAMRFALYS